MNHVVSSTSCKIIGHPRYRPISYATVWSNGSNLQCSLAYADFCEIFLVEWPDGGHSRFWVHLAKSQPPPFRIDSNASAASHHHDVSAA